MKIKLLITILSILFLNVLSVSASELPKDIKDYLFEQKIVPTVRFDSLVIYNKNIMYLPVYPAYPQEVEEVEIAKSFPENSTMEKLPDWVVFNNNFALIKLVKSGDDVLTVRSASEWPMEIKSGLIPQDIMVPRGLVLPDTLAGIIGDVHIPLMGSAKSAAFRTKKNLPLPNGERTLTYKTENVPADLKNKMFYVNNFQKEYLQIFSSTIAEPLYSLKTSGVMKDIKPALNGSVILVATKDKKNIDVIDVKNECITKYIDLASYPSEIIVDDAKKKAYVASIEDESLSIIDLETMTMKEKVQLIGSPQRLALSPDGEMIAYTDMKTSNIFILSLNDEYENKLITNYPNTTKIILDKDVMYLIARTQPQMRIVNFDLTQNDKVTKSKKQLKKEELDKQEAAKSDDTFSSDVVSDFSEMTTKTADEGLLENVTTYSTSIKDVQSGNKPIDMYKRGNIIYLLCAGDNTIFTYDINTTELLGENLMVDGFPKAFTPVPNSNLAIITNMSELKYVVYDMDKKQPTQILPINDYINMITVLERKHE